MSGSRAQSAGCLAWRRRFDRRRGRLRLRAEQRKRGRGAPSTRRARRELPIRRRRCDAIASAPPNARARARGNAASRGDRARSGRARSALGRHRAGDPGRKGKARERSTLFAVESGRGLRPFSRAQGVHEMALTLAERVLRVEERKVLARGEGVVCVRVWRGERVGLGDGAATPRPPPTTTADCRFARSTSTADRGPAAHTHNTHTHERAPLFLIAYPYPTNALALSRFVRQKTHRGPNDLQPQSPFAARAHSLSTPHTPRPKHTRSGFLRAASFVVPASAPAPGFVQGRQRAHSPRRRCRLHTRPSSPRAAARCCSGCCAPSAAAASPGCSSPAPSVRTRAPGPTMRRQKCRRGGIGPPPSVAASALLPVPPPPRRSR